MVLPRRLPVFAVALTVLCSSPVFAATSDEAGRIGPEFSLLGPTSLGMGGIVYQVTSELEAAIVVGYNSASARATTGSATASASATLINPFARLRYYPFRRHSPIVEAGVGVTSLGLTATGTNSVGDSITYDRSGLPVLVFGGVGYGFRTDIGFRLSTSIGWLGYLSSLSDSTVATKGPFDDADRAKMKRDLDKISDDLLQSRLYLQLCLAWVF